MLQILFACTCITIMELSYDVMASTSRCYICEIPGSHKIIMESFQLCKKGVSVCNPIPESTDPFTFSFIAGWEGGVQETIGECINESPSWNLELWLVPAESSICWGHQVCRSKPKMSLPEDIRVLLGVPTLLLVHPTIFDNSRNTPASSSFNKFRLLFLPLTFRVLCFLLWFLLWCWFFPLREVPLRPR